MRSVLRHIPRLRLGGRWPTLPEEWGERAKATGQRLRQASIEVAEEIHEHALAEEMRACPEDQFPAAEYLGELNKRSKGAGTRAFRLAERRRPR